MLAYRYSPVEEVNKQGIKPVFKIRPTSADVELRPAGCGRGFGPIPNDGQHQFVVLNEFMKESQDSDVALLLVLRLTFSL